ncbi:MAG: DNA repair protein RecN [Spirochaetales bacterium]|jgi:DNA repair protein RecN (Recombination protein N)|nr:DNA repair protein RecN [Spirochaetales bacterium]
MLEELHVRNYALIDNIHVNFPSGFCVLTGETGAGKSILAGALSLLLGGRAGEDIIRGGADETEVSGVFRVTGNRDAQAWLAERQISDEEGSVLVRRVIKRSGRGGVFIGSSAASVSDLQGFTALLVDLHSQHEHQSLFSVENHRRFLDRYAGLEERVGAFTLRFAELAGLREKYAKLAEAEEGRQRDMELLSFAVQEIGDAGLQDGEEERLAAERKILHEHEKLVAQLEEASGSLAESGAGAVSLVRKALTAVKAAAAIDAKLGEAGARLENIFFELEDVTGVIKDARPDSFDPERLEAIEERLALIQRLRKKYGGGVADVLAYRGESEKKLETLTNFDEEKSRLETAMKIREQELLAEAAKISEARRAAAQGLTKEIEAALAGLGMKKIRFSVPVEKKESTQGRPVCGPYGLDLISFLIAPNPGEPLKPLKSIASGGELSRVMLAIRTILAEQDDIGCLIFDEIDTGIGGEVAVGVGEFLRRLSAHKQVLVITHLASIAVQAGGHLRIEKRIDKERTFTDIISIEGTQRVQEIARMLSGEPEGAASMRHAEELLRKYSVWEK